jgi:hypothetical protein
MRLPTPVAVELDVATIRSLATPFWIDALVACLKDVIARISRRCIASA